MKIETVVRRFQENATRYGVGAALHDFEYLALNRLTRFEVLKGMVVELPDVEPSTFLAPGYDGRFVGASELEPYARAGQHDLELAFIEDAFRRGDRCHAVFEGTTLAAYGWYSTRPTAIDEQFTLCFDRAYTYMYKGYTVPAYRGKRLHGFGMARALRAITAEGGKGLVSYVLSNNFASLRSVARMGYRIFGDVYLLSAVGHALAYATPGCRPYGFRVEVAAGNAPAGAPFAALSWR
jgi:hypothetical protein